MNFWRILNTYFFVFLLFRPPGASLGHRDMGVWEMGVSHGEKCPNIENVVLAQKVAAKAYFWTIFSLLVPKSPQEAVSGAKNHQIVNFFEIFGRENFHFFSKTSNISVVRKLPKSSIFFVFFEIFGRDFFSKTSNMSVVRKLPSGISPFVAPDSPIPGNLNHLRVEAPLCILPFPRPRTMASPAKACRPHTWP